ncbi:MAG: hypothetical protein DPW09_26120 [Anaerolineae bacterium]|nr:hypothetical protein [Anaerolineae bacterium]MCQ3976920.1 hypothetical protein [Anaerolineae bacterium]
MKKKSRKQTLKLTVNIFPAIVIHVVEDNGRESATPIPMTRFDELIFQVLPLLLAILWQQVVGFFLRLNLKLWVLDAIGNLFHERRQRWRPLLITTDRGAIIKPKNQESWLDRWVARQAQELIEYVRSVWYIILFGWIIGRSITWALQG